MAIEHRLGEITATPAQAAPALRAMVHTLLFVRAPRPVDPTEGQCVQFNLTYARCGGGPEDDRLVDRAIDGFLRPLAAALPAPAPAPLPGAAAAEGGVLHSSEKSHQQQDQSTPKGCLTVSFFEKKKKKGWFNTTEERMVFEKWFFPIALVPQSSRNPQIEQQAAEDNLKRQICKIFEIVNGAIDHIPSVEYYFEIAAQKLRRSSTAVAAGTSRGGLTAGGGQQAAPSLFPPQMAGGGGARSDRWGGGGSGGGGTVV